jgi:purine-nucleoside phosphorylase
MGTKHNNAEKGEIAKIVLMPGDPLRAKYIAETYLTDVFQFNNVRGMLGFTGKYKGRTISVMGHGMGIPSIGIYSHELYDYYDVDTIVRIGSCGTAIEDIKLYDVILATGSYSTSVYAKELIGYESPVIKGDETLLSKLRENAKELGIKIHEGMVGSGDVFYTVPGEDDIKMHKKYNVLGLEMEYFALCANAKKFNKRAGCLLTVSDQLLTHEEISPEARQMSFDNMIQIALELA